ncbi:hypothetical protein LCGC14_0246010 [marine sediment metagenome]|uniref:Uncharacterized protein n=1 Tax=marine sediment metagenome TaxID=412755 RepID=A0A0F9U661_9ZZZZ
MSKDKLPSKIVVAPKSTAPLTITFESQKDDKTLVTIIRNDGKKVQSHLCSPLERDNWLITIHNETLQVETKYYYE